MKAVILAALLVTSAGLFVLVKRGPARATGVASEATGAGGPSDELSALKKEVANLKRIAVAQAARPLVAAATAPNRKPDLAAKLSPAERRQLITKTMEDRLGQESLDASWAAPRAREIRTAFAAALPDVNVVSADCASTMCKVQLEHKDLDSLDTLMERLSDVEGLGEETLFLYDRAATPPRTVLYMGRSGHHLPHARP